MLALTMQRPYTPHYSKYQGYTQRRNHQSQPVTSLFFGIVCLKSSTQVVSSGLVYASMYLFESQCEGPRNAIRRVDVLVDIRLSGEVLWVAADIDSVGVLVHANVVYTERRWELQVVKVDVAEVPRHAQVHDQVLTGEERQRVANCGRGLSTIGSWGTGRSLISTIGSAAIPAW